MNILLCSSSPRRRDIFNLYFKKIEIISPNIVENFFSLDILKEVKKVSYEKACAGYSKYKKKNKKDNVLAIGADTVVYLDEILGKPKDRFEAYKSLKKLSGKEHEVITGVSAINKEKELFSFAEKTKVKFKSIPDRVIENYIETKQWQGVAGGYKIQDIGITFIEDIQGSFSNVMGFPIETFEKYYKKFVNKEYNQ